MDLLSINTPYTTQLYEDSLPLTEVVRYADLFVVDVTSYVVIIEIEVARAL